MKYYRNALVLPCLAFVVTAAYLLTGAVSFAQNLPNGEELVKKLNERDDGVSLTRVMTIEMTDKRGKTRKQVTKTFRKYYGEEKRSAIFYVEPANIKDTAFLTYDYPVGAQEDDQWLYIPELRRVRRISASNRGDYYLGTDFTYEDMKLDTRLSESDYIWTTTGEAKVNGHSCYIVEGIPVDEKTAEELGYSKYVAYIDPETAFQRKSEVWDVNGNKLKTIFSEEWRKIQGIWSGIRMRAQNHKTGHSTIFTFSEIDYKIDIEDEMFTERALKRGVRLK